MAQGKVEERRNETKEEGGRGFVLACGGKGRVADDGSHQRRCRRATWRCAGRNAVAVWSWIGGSLEMHTSLRRYCHLQPHVCDPQSRSIYNTSEALIYTHKINIRSCFDSFIWESRGEEEGVEKGRRQGSYDRAGLACRGRVADDGSHRRRCRRTTWRCARRKMVAVWSWTSGGLGLHTHWRP